MKLTWLIKYPATEKGPDLDKPVLILSDRPHEEATVLEPAQFIGLAEKDKSGNWLCYTYLEGRKYVGFEPDHFKAKARILNEIKKEIRSRLVLAGESIEQLGQEGPKVSGSGKGGHE